MPTSWRELRDARSGLLMIKKNFEVIDIKPNHLHLFRYTATVWKERHGNHTASFRHKDKRRSTKLSGYIWTLKEEKLDYTDPLPQGVTIKWRVLALQSEHQHLQALPSREVHPDAPPRASHPQQQGRALLWLPAQTLSLVIIDFSFWY